MGLWNYVIEKEPENILVVYYYRGHAHSGMGKCNEAIDDYTKVINNNYKEWNRVYIDRGLTYLKIGMVENGYYDLEKAYNLGYMFG